MRPSVSCGLRSPRGRVRSRLSFAGRGPAEFERLWRRGDRRPLQGREQMRSRLRLQRRDRTQALSQAAASPLRERLQRLSRRPRRVRCRHGPPGEECPFVGVCLSYACRSRWAFSKVIRFSRQHHPAQFVVPLVLAPLSTGEGTFEAKLLRRVRMPGCQRRIIASRGGGPVCMPLTLRPLPSGEGKRDSSLRS